MASMRSVLNFDINLGMFGFPVKVYKAMGDLSDDAVSFNQGHAKCGQRISRATRCTTCNEDVPYGDLIKLYTDTQTGKTVQFTEAEIKALKPESTGMIKIDGYIRAGSVDPAFIQSDTWFLSPGGKDDNTFTTFRDALAKGDRWAIAKGVMYGKEHVVIIRAVEKVLMLHWVRTQNEIRDVNAIPGYAKLKETAPADYVQMMGQLMDAQQVDFEDVVLEHDETAEKVKALVKARLAGEADPVVPQAAAAPTAVDLMAALKASLAAVQK